MSGGLKPCPFCGMANNPEWPEEINISVSTNPRTGTSVVSCHTCDCIGPERYSVKEAVDMWNSSTACHERLAALEAWAREAREWLEKDRATVRVMTTGRLEDLIARCPIQETDQ